jgi:hypothetical protein
LFLAFAAMTARNDPRPSSERAWAPPKSSEITNANSAEVKLGRG